MIDTKELIAKEDQMLKEFAARARKGQFMGEKWWKKWHELMFMLKMTKGGAKP